MASLEVWLHFFAAAFAIPLGAVMLARKKGDLLHKALGRTWVGTMVFVALSSFLLPALDPAQWSPIHILSILSLAAIAYAVLAIRRGNVRGHKISMICAYLGLLGAFAGTLFPGRLVHRILFWWTFRSIQSALPQPPSKALLSARHSPIPARCRRCWALKYG